MAEPSDANELLMCATWKGSVPAVEVALKEGADIDFHHPDSELSKTGTALFMACYIGHVDVVRLLLRKGASVVERTPDSFVPLHAAAVKGSIELVDLLVQHGATLDVRDDCQTTPFMYACASRKVKTVRRLIELGARVDLADMNGLVAQTYCEYGAKMGSRECEESLKLIKEAMKTKLLRCCNPKCSKPGYRSTLKLCGRCKLTRYCSRDCQAQHWSVGHKKCCGQDAYTGEPGSDTFDHLLQYIASI